MDLVLFVFTCAFVFFVCPHLFPIVCPHLFHIGRFPLVSISQDINILLVSLAWIGSLAFTREGTGQSRSSLYV